MEVLQRTANRGSISTGPYQIDNSLKFERDNSESIVTTTQAAGNQKTWTFSAWIKRSRLSYDWDNIFGAGTAIIIFSEQDNLIVELYNGTTYKLITNRRFRDTAAWYHLVVMLDTTQGTEANRVKIYVNGVQETSLSTATYPPQDATFPLGGQGSSANWIQLGRFYSGARHFSGYMADVYYLNGTAEDADAFGETDEDTGIWIPKAYTGSGYGTQGFHYKFDNASDLGEDSSGEGHNANQKNNITAADQATDTPTNNFCTLNPLMANAGPANYLPITEGGTKAVNTAAAYKIANSTFGVTSGKWSWEVKATDVNGVTAIGVTMPFFWDADYTLQGCIYYGQTGQRYNNASASTFGATYTDGDIISFALDMDATPPTMTVYKNNSSQGNLMAGLSINGTGGAFLPVKEDGYFPKVVGYNANTFECNFGGYTSFSISSAASDGNGYGTFEYAPPTGYYALCTKNLAEFGG